MNIRDKFSSRLLQLPKALCIIKLSEKSERNVEIAGNGRKDFLAEHVTCSALVVLRDGSICQMETADIKKAIIFMGIQASGKST